MEVQVPDEPVVALFGQDATLDCSFSPDANFSLDDLTLIWQLTDTKRLVHSFSGGRDQLLDQGGDYANRTALFYDQLAQGNVSLLLRRVEVSDEGSFTCFVRDSSSAAVTLQVAGERWRVGVSLYVSPTEKCSSSCFGPLWSLFLSPPLLWSPHEVKSLIETNQLHLPKIVLTGGGAPSCAIHLKAWPYMSEN